MDAGAKDEQERARTRAKLYAPPRGSQAARSGRSAARGVSLAEAQALMASIAAEDAQITGGRSG